MMGNRVVAVPVPKVLPHREADIRGETSRSPSEGGVTGASRPVGVVEELYPLDTFFYSGMMEVNN